MKQLISVFAILAVLLTSCTSSTKKDDEQANYNVRMHQGNDAQFQDHGEDVYHPDQNMDSTVRYDMDTSNIIVKESQAASLVINAYLEIKNALAADNDKKAATAGKDLVIAFDNIDKSSIQPEKIPELKDIIADAKEHADHISENKGNIDHQREHFYMLSTDIKDLIAITGSDRPLFVIFCPMFNNNKGGVWLSASDKIRNPYYGSKMLSCGKVKTKISVK